jgi:hypothetical protein
MRIAYVNERISMMFPFVEIGLSAQERSFTQLLLLDIARENGNPINWMGEKIWRKEMEEANRSE